MLQPLHALEWNLDECYPAMNAKPFLGVGPIHDPVSPQKSCHLMLRCHQISCAQIDPQVIYARGPRLIRQPGSRTPIVGSLPQIPRWHWASDQAMSEKKEQP